MLTKINEVLTDMGKDTIPVIGKAMEKIGKINQVTVKQLDDLYHSLQVNRNIAYPGWSQYSKQIKFNLLSSQFGINKNAK